ncbi:MAG: PEP-CTERM sorting domain-containing protein [Rubrivivax sp.]|nr:MAG: PEP-CTERM sorting domain-containing protein [Rubrivivax sp.]
MIKQLGVAAAIVCAASLPSVAGAVNFDFNALSTAGRAVEGHLRLVPADNEFFKITNDVGADGTLHRQFTGINDVLGPPWTVKELGGENLSAVDAPSFEFTLDAFLHPDGSSELKVGTYEPYVPGRSGQVFTRLNFTLACQCAALYPSEINDTLFSRYDTLRNGLAEVIIQTGSVDLPDGSIPGSEERHAIAFSAVPEPSSLVMALLGVVGVAGQWHRRKTRPS